MKVAAVALLCALSAVSAEKLNARHHVLQKRQSSAPVVQAPSSSAAAPPPVVTSSTPAPAPAPATTTAAAPTVVAPSPGTTTAVGVTSAVAAPPVVATGPPPLDTGTTVPALASITSGMPTKAPLATPTFAAGATPPYSGAPGLPSIAPGALLLTAWPPQDKVPDATSSEVLAWMKELDGYTIPNLAPTADGSCVGDPAASADAANRGWWTCGGYTRPTDIVACPDKLTWGVSFDDGPSGYTQTLLNYLDQKNISATFFVVGSRVIERPNVLMEEYMQGHEISVHTWSHRPLTSLTNAQIVAELGWTRKAIKTVLGVTPTTMRPPYGDIDDRVRAISMAMGMVPIMWTATPSGSKFDTNDWRVAGGMVNGTDSFNTFESILTAATTLDTGFIVLQHDLFEITVDLAVGYTLNAAMTHQPPFNLESIGKCSKIPTTNMYLETNKNTTFPFQNTSSGVDVDGDGTSDTSSGSADGSATSAAFINAVPLLSSVALVVVAALSFL